MSILQTIADIKVPYPTEGVIRTAQLDDTVAPTNSAQLAVNMNFDRVGAIQTRPGVTEYADSLVEEINNFGTLRNAILSPGYSSLSQLGATNEIVDGDFSSVWAVKVSSTKITVFWRGVDGDGFCRNFSVDADTGVIAPIGSVLEFDPGNNAENKAILINSTQILNVWSGVNNDGFAAIFTVSGTTPAVGSLYEFDTSEGKGFSLAQIDATHVICFYSGPSNDGIATVFAISGTTITEPGSPTTYQTGFTFTNSCVALGDGTHFVNLIGGQGDIQCFEVNTGTWAITALDSPVNVSSLIIVPNLLSCEDGEHVLAVYQNNSSRLEAQAFEVDLGTFAITPAGTGAVINNDFAPNEIAAVGFGDGEHFVIFYNRNTADTGFVQMIEVDGTTFDVSLVGAVISGYDFGDPGSVAPIAYDSHKVIGVWANEAEDSRKAAMFQAFGDVVEGRWLYAGHNDEVSNTPAPGGAWTVRRSMLATVSKPRFSQYLGYIWMVNGNDNIGGDPVATSNGGDFGDDLVPDNFPAGDFIHAGFEGRVWVANKTLGIIYYTDIVQFLPPNTYTLTYNPQVNFITTITPQTGQTITALYRVPRALLVFTEDTITRIYGATSIDAYPAYNVGTYSQESIIETKTGIYFHHSSGFYQFDYGSQPVEISRRIIDFVKAIPRESYDNITGVYDGFDNVQWSVGQVVVEGVVFSNCVLRYTISTQVWTVYDYVGNNITAMIFFDDGVEINHIMGTQEGLVGAMDTGFTDFGEPFYFEFIDRWRAYTEMYYLQKQASGFNVYSENAAGANLLYQVQKSGPNAWLPIGTITEQNNALMPNSDTQPFDVMRLRIAGTTKGAQVVIHGIEITELTILGQEQN